MNLSRLIILFGAFLSISQSLASENCHSILLKAKKGPEFSKAISLASETQVDIHEGKPQVYDEDGSDGRAMIALPKVDPGNHGKSSYSAYIKLVGKPGSQLELQTCFVHSLAGLLCSQEILRLTRKTGQPELRNITKEALYIYAMLYGTGYPDRIPVNDFWDHKYFWKINASEKLRAHLYLCDSQTEVP